MNTDTFEPQESKGPQGEKVVVLKYTNTSEKRDGKETLEQREAREQRAAVGYSQGDLYKIVQDYELLEERCYKTAELLNKIDPDRYPFGKRKKDIEFEEDNVMVNTSFNGSYQGAVFPAEWIGKTEEKLRELIKNTNHA